MVFRRSLKALHSPPKFELIQAGICGCVGSPNTGFINHWFETFNRAKAYLKETESYVFKNPQMKPECCFQEPTNEARMLEALHLVQEDCQVVHPQVWNS